MIGVYLGKANLLSNNTTLHTRISKYFNSFNNLIRPCYKNSDKLDLYYSL